MLNQRTALRLAEAAAKWLASRDLRQWLNQAIVVTTDAVHEDAAAHEEHGERCRR
jgi:hypothetical protein